MRLLSRRDGRLQFSTSSEPYAILSHRWLAAEEEVSYDDVLKDNTAKPGYQKIDFCISQAERDGYKYVWIDSCCIDRTNSAELSESLNSMFRWYAEAVVCYVYLSDVTYAGRKQISQSEWFKRGWTLQELIAPRNVQFFSCDRCKLGSKETLSHELSTATRYGPLTAPISERFSWSLGRQTTRPEDISYCILGLMEVSMPPIYGEGAQKAQDRLFEAIEKEYGRSELRKIWSMITLAAQTSDSISASSTPTDELLESLRFDNMNLRRSAISDPFPDTCTWLLEHEAYRQWMTRTAHHFLWIKGKAGSGKSTLVKFADVSGGDCSRISFYFNARGTELEQSVAGMYRSLLYQVVQENDDLRSIVLGRLSQEKQYTGRTEWSLPSLQNAFGDAVRRFGQPIQCFIDALDECAEPEVQDMVYFLQDLAKNAPIFICFASRYYPNVVIDSPELHIARQQEHAKDLEDYINGRLQANEDLKLQVIRKANGVFLWAVLVVKQLNNDIRTGGVYKAQKTLKALPDKLVDLLRTIAGRDDDPVRFSVCMQWALFSFDDHNASVISFCIGVLLGLRQTHSTEFATSVLQGFTTVTDQELETWVAVWSRGLVEVVPERSVYQHARIQVIHESVREYFRGDQGRSILLDNTAVAMESHIHDSIKQTCSLGIDICLKVAETLTHRLPLPWYKFMRYIDYGVFKHAQRAAKDIPQDYFLKTFDLDTFAKISAAAHKLTSGFWYSETTYHDVGSIFRRMIGADTPLLIQTASRVGLRIADVDPKLPVHVIRNMYFADSYARVDILEALLDCEADLDVQDNRGNSALHHAVNDGRPDLCELLIDRGASVAIKNFQGWTVLHVAITCSWHLSIAEGDEFMDRGWDWDAMLFQIQPEFDDDQHISYFATAKNCTREMSETSVVTLRMLLNQSVDLSAKDEKGRTALMFAALLGSGRGISILLDAGADIRATDHLGNSALHLACAAGRAHSVSLLLSAHADANMTNSEGLSPLLATCTHDGFERAHGHAIAIDQMSSHANGNLAADPSQFGDEVWERCSGTMHSCDTEIVTLLLQHGANVNYQDRTGRTALMVVCSKAGGEAVAAILLDNGADPELHDKEGRTALRIAINHCQKGSIVTLIKRGANLLVKGNGGTSILNSLFVKALYRNKFYHHTRGMSEPTIVSDGVMAEESDDETDRALRLRNTSVSEIFEALEERAMKGERYILRALLDFHDRSLLVVRRHSFGAFTSPKGWADSESIRLRNV